jgi:hypothetical protein
MFVLRYIQKVFIKNTKFLIPALLMLDCFSVLYTNDSHLTERHFFISYDLLSQFANILYWITLFIPIAIDTTNEISMFNVSLFSRVSRKKYILCKGFAFFIYSLICFICSFVVSLIVCKMNKLHIEYTEDCIYLIVVLSIGSSILFHIYQFVSWKFNSTYISTLLFVFTIFLFHSQTVQKYISIVKIYKQHLLDIIILGLFAIVLLTIIQVITLKNKELLGFKKGMFL